MTTREEIVKAERNAHSALCVTYHRACDGSGDAHFAVTRLGDLAMGLAAEVERIRRVLHPHKVGLESCAFCTPEFPRDAVGG